MQIIAFIIIHNDLDFIEICNVLLSQACNGVYFAAKANLSCIADLNYFMEKYYNAFYIWFLLK